jgi:hypothetical protein
MRPGQLIKVLKPKETTLNHCEYGILLSEEIQDAVIMKDPRSHRVWRVLCGDRITILFEHEFEVIE